MTQVQMRSFWPLFNSACVNLGLDTREEREEYRKKVMWETSKVEHLADVNPTNGYENLMCRLAEDSGDYEQAAHYAAGSAARYRHLILARVRVILGDTTSTTPEKYVAGLIFQGRMVYRPYDTKETYAKRLENPDEWAAIPEATLRLILQLVTTEYRRRIK